MRRLLRALIARSRGPWTTNMSTTTPQQTTTASTTTAMSAAASGSNADVPLGIRLIQWSLGRSRCGGHFRINRAFAYKSSVLVLTYLAYMCFHLTRKPIAVVKSVLHRNCSNLAMPNAYLEHLRDTQPPQLLNEETWCDYPPFDGPDSAALLGYLDSAFLFTYAIAMFGSGFVAERVSLRFFLSMGMLMSGIFCYLFGAAKVWDIHSIWYFAAVQALAGLCQTTGWPGVVTVIGRWFGKSKRGLIFGIWNSHTSIGNIVGTLVAAHYLETDWALSFIVPGFIMGVVGFVVFLFLVDAPEIVGCQSDQQQQQQQQHHRQSHAALEAGTYGRHSGSSSEVDDTDIVIGEQEVNYRPTERTPILADSRQQRRASAASTTSTAAAAAAAAHHSAIGFGSALRIPGVVEFSMCLFFSKLVCYTFLYWLPLYIQSSTTYGAKVSARLSILFDVGGIFGAIAAGMITDYSGMSACTCASMLVVAVPILLAYQTYGALSLTLNVVLLFVAGLFVNGPYALITTTVSASLGQHSSLEGNAKALATVTAIIDGTGSIGAAIGPLVAGLLSGGGWSNVFRMLVGSNVMAVLLLSRLVAREITSLRRVPRID